MSTLECGSEGQQKELFDIHACLTFLNLKPFIHSMVDIDVELLKALVAPINDMSTATYAKDKHDVEVMMKHNTKMAMKLADEQFSLQKAPLPSKKATVTTSSIVVVKTSKMIIFPSSITSSTPSSSRVKDTEQT